MKSCQGSYSVTANNMANSETNGFKKCLVIQRGNMLETVVDNTQGPIKTTGNPLDLSIKGDGFFTVKTSRGDLYTRNGCFQLNEKKEIVTARGEQVLDDKGKPITINNGIPSISPDGSVYSGQNKIARLAIAKPINPSEMAQAGSGSFTFSATPATAKDYSVESGYLEGSNVNALEEMTTTIELIRNFEFAQRMLKTEQSISQKCATEVGDSSK